MNKNDEKNTCCSDYILELNDLLSNCREQLLNYPKSEGFGLARKIKTLTKKLLGRNVRVDRYFWPNGLLAIALETSHKKLGDKKDLQSLISYYENWIENGQKIYNLDNAINGYSLIYVYKLTKDEKYNIALKKIANYLINHPKDDYGSLPYRTKGSDSASSSNICADSIGMICPFLSRYGYVMNNKYATDLAVTQLLNFFEFGFDKNIYLPYHAYNAKSKAKLGIIGWGRAVGWLMIGLADSLEYIQSHEKYEVLRESFEKVVSTALQYQHNDGHFSWQLETREGPIDTSTTSMIAYAISKGIVNNILDDSYYGYVESAKRSLRSFNNNGIIKQCSAECRGLGMYPQKYGSYPWAQALTTALFSLEPSGSAEN